MPSRRRGCCAQTCTLIRRKDGLLKWSNCCTSACEIGLPVLLCALIIFGSVQSSQDTYPDLNYAPPNLTAALGTVSPAGFVRLTHSITNSSSAIPGAIPSLPLWLTYSYLLQSITATPPYDGTYLAVTPDNPDVRRMMNSIMNASVLNDAMSKIVLGTYYNTISKWLVQAGRCSAPCPIAQLLAERPPVDVRYFVDEATIETLAQNNKVCAPSDVVPFGTWYLKRHPLPPAEGLSSRCLVGL